MVLFESLPPPATPSPDPQGEGVFPAGFPGPPGTENAAEPVMVRCPRQDLLQAVRLAAVAVPETSPIPLFTHLLLTLDDQRLLIAATNLEISIQVSITVVSSATDTLLTLVPGEKFRATVEALPVGDVQMRLDAVSLTLATMGTRSTLRTADPTEYPLHPAQVGPASSVAITSGILRTLIDQTVFAAARSTTTQTRETLTAAYLECSSDALTLAAADSLWIAERQCPLASRSLLPTQHALVPARNLALLARMIPTQGTVPVQIQITPTQRQIVFCWQQGGAHVSFVSRLIDGDYPAYQKAFPATTQTQVKAPLGELVAALRRALPFATDEHHSICLSVTPAGQGSLFGHLTLEAEDADTGANESMVPAEVVGIAQQVHLSAERLRQALIHLDGSQVLLEMMAPGRAVVVLKPLGSVSQRILVPLLHVSG